MLDSNAPTLTLNAEQLHAMGIEGLLVAGTDVLVQGIARVVHASTGDHDRDGKFDAVCVTIEFDVDETQLTELPEEQAPERGFEARERRAAQLYETPRHRRAGG